MEYHGEEGILDAWRRMEGVNLSRDLLRNSPAVRGLSVTLRTNVIGDYGKLVLIGDDPWFQQAQDWFNDVWAKHADFIDGATFRECLQLIVTSLHFEGDFVVVFDDGILSGDKRGTGRLAFFETDQICNLTADAFQPYKDKGWTQDCGVLRDKLGRKCGVVVSRNRGQQETELKDAFVLTMDPNDPDAAPWRHVVRKFRLRQLRGVPPSFSTLATAIDSAELLAAELQTSKLNASRYATVIEGPGEVRGAATGFDDEIADEEGAAEGSETDSGEDEEEPRAEALETYCAGLVDYVENGSSVVFDSPNHPNGKLEEFLGYTTDVTGLAHGLSSAYARGRASSSYTAFRGEAIATWMSFRDSQQFLEDAFSDWCAVSAIRWAMKTGAIGEGPAGWEKFVSFSYPHMPSVDEGKEQNAIALKLHNGLVTYRELLGPQYKAQLKQLADELKYARDLGLPLSVFETVAGAPKDAGTTEGDSRDGEEQDE